MTARRPNRVFGDGGGIPGGGHLSSFKMLILQVVNSLNYLKCLFHTSINIVEEDKQEEVGGGEKKGRRERGSCGVNECT